MNITVYLASSTGNDSKFEEAVKELGSWIGVSGNTLVYGGSKDRPDGRAGAKRSAGRR